MPRIKINEGEGSVIEVDAPEGWSVGVICSVGNLYEGGQGQAVKAIFADQGRVYGLYHLPPRFEMSVSLQGLSGDERGLVGRVNFVGQGSRGRGGFNNYEELSSGQKVRSKRGALWVISNLQGKTEW